MKFPHANKFELGDRDFLALWKVWFDGTDTRSRYSSEGSVPRLAKNVSYQVLIDSGYGHGLDALCRLAVPPKYRNTKQATNIFVDANAHVIEHSAGCINHASDRMVKSVKLTQRAIDLLHEALTDQKLLAEAEAIIEADTEIVSANGEIVQLTNKLIAEEPPSPKCASANLPFGDLQGIVQALVDDIQYDPFQTRYRKRPIGEIVLGWSNRLTQYFWPNPTFGYSAAMKNIAPLLVMQK
jgi:hypothetical protein